MKENDIIAKIKREKDLELKNKKFYPSNKTIVMTNGCFDIIHKGHIKYLLNAAQLGDALVLALNSDRTLRNIKGNPRPYIPEDDRAFILAAFSFVDMVVIFDTTDCRPLIKKIKPDTYVKGGDYNINTMNQPERKVLEEIGSNIKFLSHVEGYSSSKIIEKFNK